MALINLINSLISHAELRTVVSLLADKFAAASVQSRINDEKHVK